MSARFKKVFCFRAQRFSVSWHSLLGRFQGFSLLLRILHFLSRIVDGFFERVECVQPERLRKLLETHRALLERNLELVRLARLPEWELSLERLEFRSADRAAEEKFLGDWGLKSLQRKQQEPLFRQAELF